MTCLALKGITPVVHTKQKSMGQSTAKPVMHIEFQKLCTSAMHKMFFIFEIISKAFFISIKRYRPIENARMLLSSGQLNKFRTDILRIAHR